MSSGENIVITGFMGTGKSTVGERVAEKLERQFVDMDLVIETRFGLPIPEIFKRHGEAIFRTVERGLAQELSAQSGLVIATGGGALVPAEMRDLMGRTGKLICLNASPAEISARLSEADNRPLAANWQALFEERQSAYARIPNQIETSGKTIAAIACEIVAMLDERIHVRTPAGGYDIWIDRGILCEINRHIKALELGGHVIIVSNETVAPLYAESLASRLPSADTIAISDGEEYKNLETVSSIYDEMLALGADRNTTLLALGGGVLGDVAGYVAATYMRGIRLIQAPTTLLAMVDSSVGGKVGVDMPQGKNLIGAFKQPEAVLVDTDVLQSLPPLQWRCGMAEVIKHGLISQPTLLDPENWEKKNLVNLLRQAIQVKVEVVEEDPYERGIRAHLNLGHTFGHAIEKVTQYSVPHGEAVAIGICKAAQLSRNCGLIDEQLVQKVISTFERIGLPVDIELNPEAWYAAMSTDKKWRAGKSRFVLLKALGEATVVEGLPKEEVLAVL
ncbi:MAG: 3-dehydroquinate synthase [Chloroflexota bacterium]|nr:3-dehydroquinate synthase [Chloroflexota bacterium]